MSNWVEVCAEGVIEPEELKGFQVEGHEYIVCRSSEGEYFGLAGLCTHEQVQLCEGMIFDNELECPKHFGTFDIKTGEALTAPVYKDLKTYPVKVEGGKIYLGL
ncbi:MAG: non-heme iron oxygenase ferredoxin subunit [Rhodobacteraceae bacterium]|nr:non-heme iron oxygenase ferredoxin subunit [Paracoccaceae bacterium]MYE35994.1 non-heme iron oxygenase ferredoxin subunit [Paracoccaceae bacterium]